MKREALIEIREGRLPSETDRYTDILDSLDERIKAEFPKVTNGALSNSHGDWYEWLLAINAWNQAASNPNLNMLVLLPNKSSLDLAQLYTTRLQDKIIDLRKKVAESSQVKFITSNPDFAIIDRSLVNRIFGQFDPIEQISWEGIETVSSCYKRLLNSCEFDDICGYLSVKTSFRPDRRLQIAHEGSLMKAIYVHLQTREWIINPRGLKYYAMATMVGNADKDALKTVATHSIISVSSIPEPAVDDVFEVNSEVDARNAFSVIMSRN